MKRLVAIFAVVVLSMTTVLPASAQEYQQPQTSGGEMLKVGVGYVSAPDIVGVLVTSLGSIEFEDDAYSLGFTPLTNISVEMLYKKNQWLSFGWSVAMGYASGRIENGSGAVMKTTRILYPTVSFVAETRYFKRDDFALYGAWGLGATLYVVGQKYLDGSGSSLLDAVVYPCMDIYPACFRWGEEFGAQIEVGWGSKGVVNCGLFFNF